GHPLEVVEGRGPDRPPAALVGARLLAQRPLPELDLADARIERLQRRRQLVHIDGLVLQRLLDLGPLGLLLPLAHERLLGERVVAGAHGGLGPLLPGAHLAVEHLDALAEALLLGDALRDLGAGLAGRLFHVADHLIDLLGGVLHPIDEIVDVRLDERRQPAEDSHARKTTVRPLRCRPTLRRATVAACGSRRSWARIRRSGPCAGRCAAGTCRTRPSSRGRPAWASAAPRSGSPWPSTARSRPARAAAPARPAAASRPACTRTC